MPTAPTAPTPFPGVPPSSQDPAIFDPRMDATLAHLPTLNTEMAGLAANAFSNASDSLSSANDSAASAAESEESRLAALAASDAAAATTGATAWVSGTTYAIGAKVWSLINGRVHVRRVAGAGTTDPANDATNWEDVIGGQRIRITGATTLQVRKLYELDSSGGAFNVTLPASFSDQDWIDFVDVGLALNTNPVTILRNGNNIRRVAEDLILDVSSDSLRLVARTSLGWIEQ